MTTTFLIGDIQRDEGCRLEAYPDPLSHGPPWTIGYGHTGRDVHPGLVWTSDKALKALVADVESVQMGLNSALPWRINLPPLIQDALVNIAFNIGVHGLLQFDTFLELLQKGEYPEAALDLRGTLWFHQVGDRALRIVRQIATNEHQE